MWATGFHSFNLVSYSPWPLLASLSIGSLVVSGVVFMWQSSLLLVVVMTAVVSLVAYQWWRDVVRESTFCGLHTTNVSNGLYLGVLLFIGSEVMFFFSFFFGFFFVSLSPDISLGCSWPPIGVEPLSCFSMPLLNTLLLLSSGVSITWAHHALLSSKLNESLNAMVVTLTLGFIFLSIQVQEYFETSFCIADSVFGSFFFLITGFHGLHVLIGLIFIYITAIRMLSLHLSASHIVGFDAAAWYWHFVDVVWLFLFVSVYWWGG